MTRQIKADRSELLNYLHPQQKDQHTHQAAERDRWRKAGKVDEEEGGDALGIQCIFEVTQEMRISAFHIVDQTTKQSSRPLKWISVRISSLQCHCDMAFINRQHNLVRMYYMGTMQELVSVSSQSVCRWLKDPAIGCYHFVPGYHQHHHPFVDCTRQTCKLLMLSH